MSPDELGDVSGPLCPKCSAPLSETLRVDMVESVSQTPETGQPVEVTYCGACGSALSATPLPRQPEPPRIPYPAEPESLDGRFQLRCRQLIDEIQDTGFMPGGWIGLITTHGAVGAARELLSSGRILPVTHWLVERGRPELTLEREITREEWAGIFDADEREEAERRLDQASRDPG